MQMPGNTTDQVLAYIELKVNSGLNSISFNIQNIHIHSLIFVGILPTNTYN